MLEKRERGHIQGRIAIFLAGGGTTIFSERGKATDFKFGMYIHRTNANKSPLKFLEKRERGRIQRVPKISTAPIYRAHRAVIFAIAQLSCYIYICCFMVKKVKERIAVNGFPSHSYGTSLAIWDHTVLPATRHK